MGRVAGEAVDGRLQVLLVAAEVNEGDHFARVVADLGSNVIKPFPSFVPDNKVGAFVLVITDSSAQSCTHRYFLLYSSCLLYTSPSPRD